MYENNKNKLFVETLVTGGGSWLKVFMEKNPVVIRFLLFCGLIPWRITRYLMLPYKQCIRNLKKNPNHNNNNNNILIIFIFVIDLCRCTITWRSESSRLFPCISLLVFEPLNSLAPSLFLIWIFYVKKLYFIANTIVVRYTLFMVQEITSGVATGNYVLRQILIMVLFFPYTPFG